MPKKYDNVILFLDLYISLPVIKSKKNKII